MGLTASRRRPESLSDSTKRSLTARAPGREVLLDDPLVLGVETTKRIQPGEFFEVSVIAHVRGPKAVLSLASAARMRLLTVPSGVSRRFGHLTMT